MLCEFYGTEPPVVPALMGLAKETKAKGWWQSYNDLVMPNGSNAMSVWKARPIGSASTSRN